ERASLRVRWTTDCPSDTDFAKGRDREFPNPYNFAWTGGVIVEHLPFESRASRVSNPHPSFEPTSEFRTHIRVSNPHPMSSLAFSSPVGYRNLKDTSRRVSVWPLVVAIVAIAVCAQATVAQDAHAVRIAAVKYSGGGEWYQGQTPLPNVLAILREDTLPDVAPQPDVVELTSGKLLSYPFVCLSGHGNPVLTEDEARRLRRYLENGGFLYIDDDYGLDEYI